MAAFAQRGWVAISPDCGNFVFYFAIALQFILLVSVARVSVSKVLSCVHYYRSSDCPCLGWCYGSYIDMLRLVSLAVVSRPHACHDSPFISSSSSSSVITHCVNESIFASHRCRFALFKDGILTFFAHNFCYSVADSHF